VKLITDEPASFLIGGDGPPPDGPWSGLEPNPPAAREAGFTWPPQPAWRQDDPAQRYVALEADPLTGRQLYANPFKFMNPQTATHWYAGLLPARPDLNLEAGAELWAHKDTSPEVLERTLRTGYPNWRPIPAPAAIPGK
jgi:hypothetical protein